MTSTTWVKGELTDTLEGVTVDPRHMLDAAECGTPFERLGWFRACLPLCGSAAKPLVARAWNEGGYAWLFLADQGQRRATALASWYSFAFGPVFRNCDDRSERLRLLRAIARRLRRVRGGPVEIVMAPVPRRGGASGLMREALRSEGWAVLRHQSSTSWTVSTVGKNFCEYWAERPGQLRNTHDRKAKKYGLSAEVLTRFDDQAWADYESVYGESWKPREGDAAFLRDFARRESEAGRLRLALVRDADQVVAAQFWTVENGTAYIHKLAHRESARHLSAGTIASAALFRQVIDDDQVDQVDFGTGNDRYKADWMDESTPLDTIRAYRINHPAGLWRWVKARLSALRHGTKLD